MTAKGRLLTEAKLNDIDYHLVVITERVYKVNDDYDKSIAPDGSNIHGSNYWQYDDFYDMKRKSFSVRKDVEGMDPKILLKAYNVAPKKIDIDTNAKKSAPVYQQLKHTEALFWHGLSEYEFWEVLAALLNTTVNKTKKEKRMEHILDFDNKK